MDAKVYPAYIPAMLGTLAESFLAFLIAAYIAFVGLTSRLIVRSPRPIEQLRRPTRPVVFAFWHNRILYFCWLFRNSPVAIPISTHRDGRIAARVARLFGFLTIPGSTHRNPVHVLRTLVSALARNLCVAITPDGPRGPLYSIQDGLFYAAWKSQAPIVGAAWYARKTIRLKTWDRFILPLPFNTFVVRFTREFHIPSRKAIAETKNAFRSEFERITRETETFFS